MIGYGKCTRAGKGGYSYAMDRRGHDSARRAMGEAAYGRIADRLGIYVILSEDDQIITVAHRIRKRRRH